MTFLFESNKTSSIAIQRTPKDPRDVKSSRVGVYAMNIKVFWFDSGLKYKIILRRSGKVCSVLTHSDGTLIINLQFVSSYGANGVSWALVKDGSIIKAEDPATTLATEDAKPRLDTDVVPSLGIDSAATTVSPAMARMEMRSLNKNLSIVISIQCTLVSP